MSQFDLLPDSILSLTGKAADRLLALGDGDAALLYLHALRHGSTAVPGWSAERVRIAGDKLAAAKLITAAPVPAAPTPAEVPEPLPPEYSTADVTAALAGEASFSALVDEVERRLGKKLSTNDLKTLFTLYDHLALPPEVILLIVGWCQQETTKKYGPGRKPFLSTISKEAFRWARAGIDTAEAADAHLKKLLSTRTREAELAQLLDLPNRPLVERERNYFAAWTQMGFDDGALRLAYEKTVMGSAGKSMDWRYMNGILRRWHEKGLHTLQQVEAENQPAARTAKQVGKPIDQTPDRQAREDMERMRRLMQQMKQAQEKQGEGE